MDQNKRYQVFVSSTFRDLLDERKEIMQALLELDCFPAGMELFPASNEESWKLIQKVIDECDYYIVVVAGRYGTLGPDGISYTEMEYDYADGKGIPIIGFLHEAPGELPAKNSEPEPDNQKKLAEFCMKLRSRNVKEYRDAVDLGSKVSRSLINLIKNHERPGWVRGGTQLDERSGKELVRLYQENDQLKNALNKARTGPPPGTHRLARGTELFTVKYIYSLRPTQSDLLLYDTEEEATRRQAGAFQITWDDLFGWFGPIFAQPVGQSGVTDYVEKCIMERFGQRDWLGASVNEVDLTTVIYQFKALGYLSNVSDDKSGWVLTPYGDEELTKLKAVLSAHQEPT